MRSQLDKKTSRLQFQAAEMLENRSKALQEEEDAKIKNDKKVVLESAFQNIGSHIHNTRVARQSAERALAYEANFTTNALAEALTVLVENSLLLNVEEYAKLNPNYRAEIKDTISAFLESDSVNQNITNKDTLVICEEIKKNVPPANLYLTEEQEFNITNNEIMSSANVERSLDSLSRDVRARVASIVAKDQEALAARQDDIDYAEEKEAEVAPTAVVDPQTDEMPLADPEAIDAEQPVAQPNPEQAPITESKKPTFRIGKNAAKTGIVETLTINEANKMLSEGKEYNSTLALANAIKYITILEAIDAADIVSIGTNGYNRILSASGAKMNPVSKVNIPGANIVDTPFATLPKSDEAGENKFVSTNVDLPEDKKESDIRSKIADMVNTQTPSEFYIGSKNNVYEPFKKWSTTNTENTNIVDTPITEQMYKTCYGEMLTEAQVRERFEREGFDLDFIDFDTLCYDWQIVKL